jgi:glycosyltransferase involved in cell wall biosynthesis
MKVSIITAVKNAEATIGDTLASVASQTYANVEHVVADGASTDATMEIARKALGPQGVLTSQADGGIYDAFNRGFAASTGDIIAYLNADDYYASPTVIEVAALMISSAQVDAVFADAVFIARDNRNRITRRYRSSIFSPDTIRWGLIPAHSTMFLRRSVFDDIGIFDPSFRIAGDFDLIARWCARTKARYAYVPRVFTVVRSGGASSSGVRSTNIISREMLRSCRKNGIYSNRLMISARYLWKCRELFGAGHKLKESLA